MDTRSSNNMGGEGRPVAAAGGTYNANQRTELQLRGPPTGGSKGNAAPPPPGSVPGSGRGDPRADANAGKMSEANQAGETEGEGGNVVWNAYQRGKWVNGQWIPKVCLRRWLVLQLYSPNQAVSPAQDHVQEVQAETYSPR